jgi:hypothetical protein
MSKHLDEKAMQRELSGSAFFDTRQDAESSTAKPSARDAGHETKVSSRSEIETPRHRGPTTPLLRETEEVIETIRRAVHQFGKEDATYRFTGEEKKALADIVYTYGTAGIKTSQNEITRIAINWLVEDYRANGEGSILARVIARLNA